VALDTGGIEAAAPWIDRAKATHPSLIDQAHVLDELLGVVNVPMGVWVGEDGILVRPPEPAFPWRPRPLSDELMTQLPEVSAEQLREAQKMQIEPEAYVAALRDWVQKGSESEFALSPEEVIERSRPRDASESEAAAAFELGQHLHRAGQSEAAVGWFRQAHRLAPDNWTYKRQAWSLADPLQDRTEQYDSDWLTDVRRIGAENYYPKVDL
jgi:tetratricopeptide (TPR) repeat protein